MNAAQEYADHAAQHAAAHARIAEGDAFLAWFETCLTPVDAETDAAETEAVCAS